MTSNRELSRSFNLFAELLQLHNGDAQLAGALSGAAYRLRNLTEEVSDMSADELKSLLRPPLIAFVKELQSTGTIGALDNLVQITPPGLFEMMRIKGLGGKKLSVIWHTAKIDTLEGLLEAAKNNQLSAIPGFGTKTEANIVAAIESYTAGKNRFYYADVADIAAQLVAALQKACKTELISLCGEVRRQLPTVASIEIIAAVSEKALRVAPVKKWLVIDRIESEKSKNDSPGEAVAQKNSAAKRVRQKGLSADAAEQKGLPAKRAKQKDSSAGIIKQEPLRPDSTKKRTLPDTAAAKETSPFVAITHGHTLDELPVTIYHTSKKAFFRDLFERTGNAAHVEKVLAHVPGEKALSSEEMIYRQAKLPFIVPEMREDVAEWVFAERPGQLVAFEDIRGVVHNHTTWSDGVDTLVDFSRACRKRGYEYVVISDHSKNAHYAGGLKEEKVRRQFEEIDALNKKLAPFKIFKSIECDILVSGELDYDPALLKEFDLVIVSVHQLLKMDEKKATARLVRAIENPYTTILGHMTGRQLLIRPGYPVNFTRVIDACAANGVVIELNANPYRLDMDWTHIPYALSKGVMISINPDAHSIGEIDNIRWGISAARKAGLTVDRTWNAMSLKKIEEWLADRK